MSERTRRTPDRATDQDYKNILGTERPKVVSIHGPNYLLRHQAPSGETVTREIPIEKFGERVVKSDPTNPQRKITFRKAYLPEEKSQNSKK